MEKIVLLVCITMLLCQNYYSLTTYWQQDYIETKADEQLPNVDLPMIVICGENSFINNLDPLRFDSKWEFIGWANQNTSAKDDIKSNTRLQNVTDIVNAAHTLDELMYNHNSAKDVEETKNHAIRWTVLFSCCSKKLCEKSNFEIIFFFSGCIFSKPFRCESLSS